MKENKLKEQISIADQVELATNRLLEHLSAEGVNEQTLNTVVAHFEDLDPCQKIGYVAALTKSSNKQVQQSTSEVGGVDEKRERRNQGLNSTPPLQRQMYHKRRGVSTARFNTAKGG